MQTSKITIPVDGLYLKGNLNIPQDTHSFVIFSHGSGGCRFNLAKILNDQKIATLLIDLLTEKENEIQENRFDVELITWRLMMATNHVIQQRPGLENLKFGYFGSGTGAASALKAASRLGDLIQSVVSRGGRPDLAEEALPLVKAPTLLMAGSLDDKVIELNQKAYNMLRCEKKLEIVQGATHLFEEPGKLDEVGNLAAAWFIKHLQSQHVSSTAK